jgi:pilus assembly protein Flp/PilA
MANIFAKILTETKAATAIEYGLIAALIAVAMVTAVTSVGGKVGTTMNNVGSKMKAT